MDNMTYMNNENTGASNCAPSTETASNEAYMNAQAQPTQVVEAVEAPKPYTFRKLNSTDLFPMIKIISKIGIDELTQVLDTNFLQNIVSKVRTEQAEKFEAVEGTEQVEQTEQAEKPADNVFLIGMGIALKVANKILEHIPSCENEIYTLLGNVSGMGSAKVKELDLDVFLEMIMDFIMKDEFKNFFKVASKYINQ